MIKNIRIDETEIKAKSKHYIYSLLASSGDLNLSRIADINLKFIQ